MTPPDVARRLARRKGAPPRCVTFEECIDLVDSDALWAFGGSLREHAPAGMARAIIRAGKKDLSLLSMPSSYPVDLLLAADAVKHLYTMFVSFEERGLAPGYRRAVETGHLTLTEIDGPVLFSALKAAACDLPWFPARVTGNDIAALTPSCVAEADLGDPHVIPISAIRPNLTVLQGAYADRYGNVYYPETSSGDFLLATASDLVVACVEEIREDGDLISPATLPSFLVDYLVVQPLGGHPLRIPDYYDLDEEHMNTYLRAVRESKLEEYAREWVYVSPERYSERLNPTLGQRVP